VLTDDARSTRASPPEPGTAASPDTRTTSPSCGRTAGAEHQLIRAGAEPELWFEDIVVLADMVAGELQVAGVCDDPDDDKYLAAALEGRAAYVVTGDQRFLEPREHEGVQIVKPRAFLEMRQRRAAGP
jgi:hypothetical protein